MMASWEELTRNSLLEEEEDEELFFVLLPAVMPFLDEEKTPENTSSLPGAKKVKEILEGHENWCKEEFRMEAEMCYWWKQWWKYCLAWDRVAEDLAEATHDQRKTSLFPSS